jgi:hypothetical protein
MKKILLFLLAVLLVSTVSAYLGRVHYDDGNLIVTVINHDKPAIRDAKVRATMPSLGIASSTDMVTIKADRIGKSRMLLEMPEGAEPDYYPVIITINHKGHREVKHTWVYIE